MRGPLEDDPRILSKHVHRLNEHVVVDDRLVGIEQQFIVRGELRLGFGNQVFPRRETWFAFRRVLPFEILDLSQEGVAVVIVHVHACEDQLLIDGDQSGLFNQFTSRCFLERLALFPLPAGQDQSPSLGTLQYHQLVDIFRDHRHATNLHSRIP